MSNEKQITLRQRMVSAGNKIPGKNLQAIYAAEQLITLPAVPKFWRIKKIISWIKLVVRIIAILKEEFANEIEAHEAMMARNENEK